MQFDKHVKVRQEKFGAVVFETLREKVYVTNGGGAEILRLLEEGKAPDEVVAELAEAYDRDPAIIRADVEEFLATLEDQGIIKKEQ